MDRGHSTLPRYRGSGSFSNLNTASSAQDAHAFQAYSASTPDISSLYAAQQVRIKGHFFSCLLSLRFLQLLVFVHCMDAVGLLKFFIGVVVCFLSDLTDCVNCVLYHCHYELSINPCSHQHPMYRCDINNTKFRLFFFNQW